MANLVQPRDLSLVARRIPPNVLRQLAREHLLIPEGELEQILSSVSDSVYEKVYQLLTKWKNQNGHAATQEALVDLLRNAASEGLVSADLTDFVGQPQAGLALLGIESLQGLLCEWYQDAEWTNLPRFEWMEVSSRYIKLEKVYTKLAWVYRDDDVNRVNRLPMDEYTDMFTKAAPGVLLEQPPKRIVVEGDAGIGKSTFAKYLAFEWSKRVHPVLNKFDFVFVLKMKDIEDNSPIQDLIQQQTKRLTRQFDTRALVTLVNEKTPHKVLLVLDGFDELSQGVNKHIEEILGIDKKRRQLFHWCVLLTSRPSEKIYPVKRIVNTQAEILGFDLDHIAEYATKLLGNEKQVQDLLAQAEKQHIFALLKIPMILQMVCFLYIDQSEEQGRPFASLPSTATKIFENMVTRVIKRGLRRAGKNYDPEVVKELLIKLGKLAFKAFLKGTKTLFLKKTDVDAEVGHDVYDLGLLSGKDEDVLSVATFWLLFPHKLVQEFAGAYFAVKAIESGNMEEITSVLTSFQKIDDLKMILQFACGLSATAGNDIINHVASVGSDSIQAMVKSFDWPSIVYRGKNAEYQYLFQIGESIVATEALPWGIRKKDSKVLAESNLQARPVNMMNEWNAILNAVASVHNLLGNLYRECEERTQVLPSVNHHFLCMKGKEPMTFAELAKPEVFPDDIQYIPRVCTFSKVTVEELDRLPKMPQSFMADAEDDRKYTVLVTEPQMGENPMQWVYSFTQWMKNMPRIHHFLVNKMNIQVLDDDPNENDRIDRFSNQLSHAVFASQQLVCLKVQESQLHPLMQKAFFCGVTENNETRLRTCQQLEVINLQSTRLTAEVGYRFCTMIGELSALTKLDLRNCDLTKDACAALSRGIVGLRNLTYLDLSNNPLEELAGNLTEALREWFAGGGIKLTHLYLMNCKIPRESMEGLWMILGEAKELIMINASGNEVKGTVRKFLMSPPTTLERLLLWNTQATKDDLKAIVESIGGEGGPLKLPRLKAIDLMQNNLTGEDVEPILDRVNRNYEGKFVFLLRNNNITEEFKKNWLAKSKKRAGMAIGW